MATITDVALKAGVSKSTVSNVFSKKRPIGQAVTRRVLEAAKELGYHPTYWARQQGLPKNRIIGLLLQNTSVFTSFHFSLMKGIVQACREYGYRLLVNTVPPPWTVEPDYVAGSPVDGEIVLDPTEPDGRIEERIKQGMPMVVIGRPPYAYAPHLSSVDNDNTGAAQQVTDYLLELGHTQIAFINAPRETTVSQAREAGYRAAFNARRVPVPEQLLHYRTQGMEGGDVHELALQLLRRKPQVTAIMADSSQEAAEIYRAAAEEGIGIPARLSVFAFMNSSEQTDLRPGLSSVNLNAEDLGFEAAKLLIERCEGRGAQIKQVAIGTTLDIKGSCAAKI
ncbi:LacI family DNA-binding transcriptional regulator [Paenibacillus sp. S150]|uniref:LacI family DNA-binding transcriptional regulator n=1 Tax=Paenibacillus sp. S150 TaxID=2749826 RepID=UPI001C57BC7C|nr:LacI family DNA-binding transcriptional regulator [Paenibacillus sp. S150]MBW4082491.1 LacI family DNA-binding transcriptional regulator [Paenibacillus sp. S150]